MFGTTARAADASRYASGSVLASGKWSRVKVAETGLQFISNANLKSLGFSDPAKVNVYGFGGRLLPDELTELDADDLPILPIVRTSKGIYFFGFNHIRWTRVRSTRNLTYEHSMQPYAEESYYYLSDRDADEYVMGKDGSATAGSSSGTVIDSFTQMLLHEQELVHPGTSGRVYLGEDFRSPSKRSFRFTLTDIVDGTDARARVQFGTNTTGSSSLLFTANGKRLPATATDNIAAVTSVDQFIALSPTIKTIEDPGTDLNFEISFQNSGSITQARLDFIELEYTRRLRLNAGQLYFNVIAQRNSVVKVEGCEAATQIWNITDPVRPTRVDFRLEGSTAVFSTTIGNYEYIAFTPDKGGYAIGSSGESVANQDLHALEVPEMLIITPVEYMSAAERLAKHHREFDDMKVHVLTPAEIYNEFSSGTPDVGAFRRLLKMWYERGLALDATPDTLSNNSRIKYCLIMSRPTYDNKMLMEVTKSAKYPRIPIWQSLEGNSKNTSYSTDDYIGMLEDTPRGFNIATAKIQVGVGRMPVTSIDEATLLVDKYIDYVTKPELSDWRNRIMVIADDQDNGIHFNQAQEMYRHLSTTQRGENYLYDRVYLDSYPMESGAMGLTYPKAKERMLRLWNDGVSMIDYIGHASAVNWGHENLLTWTDINSFSNSNLPFLYAATCEFGRYDDDSRSGAEVLWAYPNAGLIGLICPSRTVFISPNGTMSASFGKVFFNTEEAGRGRRIGDIFKDTKNGCNGSDDNKLRFSLIGNPAMRFPVPEYRVEIDSLSGVALDGLTATDLPVLKARGKARLIGRIANEQGATIENFNGTVEIRLYDAEKTIETLGNGEDGVVSYYNDRNTQLYRGLARVVNGKWETTVMLPSEIENNYTPGRFTLYAYSSDGKEAHGQTTKFYVYGYDETAGEDDEGPEIKYLAMNREGFANGGVVHTSPVVIAAFSDPSGINLSDAGIGHKMTLVLDSKKYFEDVNSYYTPDFDDTTAGTILYPLSDLEPGKHNIKLTVFDNAGNSSSASVDFEVAVTKAPEIFELTTDANPAHESVNFTLSTDRPMTKVDCRIEVFDLNGHRVWQSDNNVSTDILASLRVAWDLRDTAGRRIPRGIYLYRATITSDMGTSTTQSRKLAVAAE